MSAEEIGRLKGTHPSAPKKSLEMAPSETRCVDLAPGPGRRLPGRTRQERKRGSHGAILNCPSTGRQVEPLEERPVAVQVQLVVEHSVVPERGQTVALITA